MATHWPNNNGNRHGLSTFGEINGKIRKRAHGDAFHNVPIFFLFYGKKKINTPQNKRVCTQVEKGESSKTIPSLL